VVDLHADFASDLATVEALLTEAVAAAPHVSRVDGIRVVSLDKGVKLVIDLWHGSTIEEERRAQDSAHRAVMEAVKAKASNSWGDPPHTGARCCRPVPAPSLRQASRCAPAGPAGPAASPNEMHAARRARSRLVRHQRTGIEPHWAAPWLCSRRHRGCGRFLATRLARSPWSAWR
jgi:hypothetical protein